MKLLAVTFDLSIDTWHPHRKLTNQQIYINIKLNHTPFITQHIYKSIAPRLSTNSKYIVIWTKLNKLRCGTQKLRTIYKTERYTRKQWPDYKINWHWGWSSRPGGCENVKFQTQIGCTCQWPIYGDRYNRLIIYLGLFLLLSWHHTAECKLFRNARLI